MGKRKRRRTSRSAAIRTALGQLGWHATAKDVVALLANCGIDVNEGLVHKVKLEGLKHASKIKRQKALVSQIEHRRKLPRVRRVPPQRTYRR